MAGTLLWAVAQTRNHNCGSIGQSVPSIYSVQARCYPTLDEVIKAVKELKPNKAPGFDGIAAKIIPVWWWHTDIMHAPAVHKAVGSCRTTTRPQRCISHDHLQEQGRQERLQHLPWHLTSISCRKMPCEDHPQMPGIQHHWQHPTRKPVQFSIRS